MDLPFLFKNHSESSVPYVQERPDVSIPYLLLVGIAMVLGTCGNALVIGSVIVYKQLRRVSNVFIVNLAIADLCVTSFVDPFSIVGFVKGENWFNQRLALCETVASICLTSCFCSLLSIGAISLNRYIHICHNHLYLTVFTLRNTVLMAVALWIISFLAEMPNFLGWGDHVYDKKLMFCAWDRTADYSYTMFFAGVGIALPVLVITICYVRIYYHVVQSKKKVNTQCMSKKATKDQNNSVKLVKTFFIIFVVFAVCWTPYAVFITIDFADNLSEEYYTFSVLLAHGSSSVNGLLYGLTNMQFRKGYAQLLRRLGCTCCKFVTKLAPPTKSDTGTRLATLHVPSELRLSQAASIASTA